MYNIKYIYIYVCVCVFDIDVVQKASKNCLVCKKLPFPNTLFVYSSFFWHVHGVHGPCITTTAVLPWFVAAKLKGWNQQLQRTFWSFNAQFHNCQLGSVLSKSTSFQLQSKFQIKTMGGRKSKSSFSVDCFSKKNDVPLEHSKLILPHFHSWNCASHRWRGYILQQPQISRGAKGACQFFIFSFCFILLHFPKSLKIENCIRGCIKDHQMRKGTSRG